MCYSSFPCYYAVKMLIICVAVLFSYCDASDACLSLITFPFCFFTVDDHDRTQMMTENQRMADELKELRSHLSKSAAVVGDYGGLQRDLDCSEKQRTQLSDHIQVKG